MTTLRYHTLVAWLMFAGLLAGCNRAFYRTQADADANCLTDQKASMVGADGQAFRIDLDPRSRMFSPENPDCPAMPPDDPVAHAHLECIDSKRGARSNRLACRTPHVENPDWRAHLPRDAENRLVLDLQAAVELGLLHSPRFQGELEELYLSALDVSFERFLFDTQFFGGSSIDFEALGRNRTGTGNASSVLTVSPSRPGNRFRLEKFTATGGQIVVGFANSLIWQFAGPNDYTSTTLLDFSILQPLLRTGGRTFVLERLTIAERALLSNVRAMERFRRGFYLNIATGADAGQGPSRRGGFFGGSGLTGFSGVGGGGFGRVGGGGGGGGGFGNFGSGIGAAGAGGYIGLLQQTQELRNQRANVVALRASVDQLEASFDAGRIDRFQVDLARQALFDGQSLQLTAEADLRSSIDGFLFTLGLPPDLEVQLSDDMLAPFELRSDELTTLQSSVGDLATDLRSAEMGVNVGDDETDDETGDATSEDASEPEVLPQPGEEGPALAAPAMQASSLEADEPEPTTPDEGDPIRERAAELAEQALTQIDEVEADYQKLLDAAPSRKEHLELLGQRDEVRSTQIDPRILSPLRFQQRVDELREDLDAVAQQIEMLTDAINKASSPSAKNDKRLRQQTEELADLLLELSLLQARARLDTVDIDPTEITNEEALKIASLYRRDWKNARTALVDAWRLINFNANALLSDVDIMFAGDIGNVGDNPFRLSDTNGRLRVGLEFDTPITRLNERNIYRQALIEYDQARRNYYQFVDGVSFGLRSTLRQIRLNEINFELRREAVLVAIAQVELTQLRLSEPPKPGEESSLGGTTARDLVEALADLLGVQNDFLSVWVNNRVQRLLLEFDLGLMELDPRGLRLPPALPLKEYLNAAVHAASCSPDQCSPTECDPTCDPFLRGRTGSLPERLPADIQPLEPTPTCLPAAEGELKFPVDLTSAENRGVADDQLGLQVQQANYEQPAQPISAPRRLPAP